MGSVQAGRPAGARGVEGAPDVPRCLVVLFLLWGPDPSVMGQGDGMEDGAW